MPVENKAYFTSDASTNASASKTCKSQKSASSKKCKFQKSANSKKVQVPKQTKRKHNFFYPLLLISSILFCVKPYP